LTGLLGSNPIQTEYISDSGWPQSEVERRGESLAVFINQGSFGLITALAR